jgi:hypothetical protein
MAFCIGAGAFLRIGMVSVLCFVVAVLESPFGPLLFREDEEVAHE